MSKEYSLPHKEGNYIEPYVGMKIKRTARKRRI